MEQNSEQDLNQDFPLLSDSWFDDISPAVRVGQYANENIHNNDLQMDMELLQKPVFFSTSSCSDYEKTHDLQLRLTSINKRMGSMAQCRGRNGETLREAGAIHGVLSLLHHIEAAHHQLATKGGPHL